MIIRATARLTALPLLCLYPVFPEDFLQTYRLKGSILKVHTNGSHQNGKRGSHVSTVSIYRQEEPAMGGNNEEPEPGIGMCGWLLTSISWFVVIITLPFSLCVCFKVSSWWRYKGLTVLLHFSVH